MSDQAPGSPPRATRHRGPVGATAPRADRPPVGATRSPRPWSATAPSRIAEDWARSGVPLLTGHPDGPPLLPPGGAAAFASWLADHVASAGGARLDGARLLAERAAFSGRGRRGRLSVGGSCRLLPTRDGWAAVSDARPDDPLLWSALIGRDLDAEALPRRLADWLAAHDGAELDERVELLGLAGGTVGPRPERACPLPGPPRDVAGLLVVDFSSLWAGPLCAHLLGSARARVVKVETPSRPDGARFGDSSFYDLLHAGHHSVVLDPGDPRGRTALHELVGRADVVIEASRPRALAGFGLDAEAEAARGCTWISITAHGRASGRVGFGDDVAASRGLLATDADGGPVFAGDAVADPLTGLLAAALALSEQPGGGGVIWDVSMADVVSTCLSASAGDARLVGRGDDWLVDTGRTSFPVAVPRPRRPVAAASASGADTATVLRGLGIRLP
ncbi:CoA transferase [Streptomyces sp. NBC_01235]|uniref:CoA transferase n=1 Tax=Streptomyces sp. NBC_01235 TaxID=2903788 RepID=UPI002E165B41|nr:CoA transferase [Streptomyces sp. NBC_01235]